MAQFAFNLDIDSELISAEELARRAVGMRTGTEEEEEEREEMNGRAEGGQWKMREGARDMLIKHHLFSWEESGR